MTTNKHLCHFSLSDRIHVPAQCSNIQNNYIDNKIKAFSSFRGQQQQYSLLFWGAKLNVLNIMFPGVKPRALPVSLFIQYDMSPLVLY